MILVRCENCESEFSAYPSDARRFCSVKCRLEAVVRLERKCAHCSQTFTIRKSALGPRTNARGRFCGKHCYHTHLARGGAVKGRHRGSMWRKIRAETLRLTPFCICCGRFDRLQVHHIIPFRITRDNRQMNLLPLCTKHHKIVESAFIEFEATCGGQIGETELMAWRVMLEDCRLRMAIVLEDISDGRIRVARRFDRAGAD